MYMYVDRYTVRPGDTLSNIAGRFDLLTYTQILHVNPGLSNPNLIYPGQVINIPKLLPMSTYIVKPGETLGNIVYNYNRELMEVYGHQITFDEVLAYNPMITNPNLIYPGMVIYLPEIL
jgi:hypothetical protein